MTRGGARRNSRSPAEAGKGNGVGRAVALAYGLGPAITGQAALDAALGSLRALDPLVIDHLVEVGGPPPLRLRTPGFAGLAAIVTGQQVSTASAAAIFGRLEAQVRPLDAATFLTASDETLRAVGLSLGKVRTLRAVATATIAGALALDTLGTLPAEEAHAALVAIKGIGPWTADSFLLFCLGHADAWPAGDIALQEAARVALKREARPTAAELQALGDRWRPHRGVAARLLWAYYRAIKNRGGMILAAESEGAP